MALFGFGKKKEEVKENTPCCCGSLTDDVQTEACNDNPDNDSCCSGECSIKSVKVLGAGCRNCHDLYEASIAAVKELGMKIEIEYITDMEKIMSYGVMSMPALVINEKVVSMGKVLKKDDIIKLFKRLGYC